MTYEHTKIENLPPETPCVILNLADFCFEPYAFTILTSRFKVLIKLFFHLNEREQTSNKLGISFFRGSQDEDKPPVFAMMYDSLFTFRWQLSAFSFLLFRFFCFHRKPVSSRHKKSRNIPTVLVDNHNR